MPRKKKAPASPEPKPRKTMGDRMREANAEIAKRYRKTSGDVPVNTEDQMKEDEQGSDPIPAMVKLSPSPTSEMTIPRPSVTTSDGATGSSASLLAGRIKAAPKVDAPHLIVEARAGTGKTTTLIEGLKVMRAGSFAGSSMTPSPQQAAVWEQMLLSKDARSVCFVAFNRSIAAELKRRVPPGCDAMTMHGMGFRAVLKAFPGLRNRELNERRTEDLLAELTGASDRHDLRRRKPALVNAVNELVGLCKMNLVDFGYPGTLSESRGVQSLDALASHYDVELDRHRDEAFNLVPRVLEACRDPQRGGMIDYDDMIWLPVVLGLPIFRNDLLLVDEAQDLNRCQQELAKRAGRRLILVGDPRQAIYGFAGADAESMPRMARELNGNEACDCGADRTGPSAEAHDKSCPAARGCQTLPLTVTRRCGRAIVEEARRIIPDFEAHESCCEGKVSQALYPTDRQGKERVPQKDGPPLYTSLARDGDMVLCRVNAPLVSQCFRFLRAGRKANIVGRDVGAGLLATIKRAKAAGVPELIAWLGKWLEAEEAKERAKRNPSDGRLIALRDRHDCLLCFCEGAIAVTEVEAKVRAVFTDDPDAPGIRLSSIHKAKGLEAKRVFLLQPEGAGVPHPMARTAWQREQEMNILYVALTRAIEELVYVS